MEKKFYIGNHRIGATLQRIESVNLLEKRIERFKRIFGCDYKVSIDDITRGIDVLSEIPIRAAVNVPEYYGAIRLNNTRGYGDVVCMPSQVDELRKNLNYMNDVEKNYILQAAVPGDDKYKNLKEFDAERDSADQVDKFLAIFDQPSDDLLGDVKANPGRYSLNVPKPQME